MKYRIVPATPSAEQIKRGMQWCIFPERVYAAMIEQCPEVTGDAVDWQLANVSKDVDISVPGWNSGKGE